MLPQIGKLHFLFAIKISSNSNDKIFILQDFLGEGESSHV